MKNTTLYLMTQKGFDVLKALIDKNLQSEISKIIVGRDSNIENDFADEIIMLCKHHNIPYFNRNEKHETSSKYSIAISWRWLIPESNTKLIVLHDSLLPKYRGFAPLVNMLLNKEKEIGVSAIFASKEYDKGDIIAQSSTKITYPLKIADAINLVSKNYIELIVKLFNMIKAGDELKAIPQNEDLASYSLWRDDKDYLINWQKDAEDILNFINAVSHPYKGAVTFINSSQKIRIYEADLEKDVLIENRDVGKVIFVKENYPVIVCGKGLLKLTKVVNYETLEDLLPFKNFRIRLTN